MISRAWFHNFKAIEKMSIDLGRLTILVGPNGSGKTSVLEGIHLLAEAIHPASTSRWVRTKRFESIARKKSDGHVYLEMDVSTSTGRGMIEIDAPKESWMDALKLKPRYTWACFPGYETEALDEDSGSPQSLMDMLRSAMLIRLEASKLAIPSYSDLPVPKVLSDGEGLASAIAYLIISEPERLEHIAGQLRRLFPSVRKIRAERARAILEVIEEHDPDKGTRVFRQPVWGYHVLLDTIHADGIPLSQASEGITLALGLLAILHSQQAPRVLLWDDIDKAFHPKAQQDLIPLIRDILKEIPELQIVGTTHSPYLLDALSYDEVRVMAMQENGALVCAPLTEHPAYEKWKDDVKPGELWMSRMEKWVHEKAGVKE